MYFLPHLSRPKATFRFDRIFLLLIIVTLLLATPPPQPPEAVLFTSHISKCCRKHAVGGQRDKTSCVHSQLLCGFLAWGIII